MNRIKKRKKEVGKNDSLCLDFGCISGEKWLFQVKSEQSEEMK
jgi:hypothetical protein